MGQTHHLTGVREKHIQIKKFWQATILKNGSNDNVCVTYTTNWLPGVCLNATSFFPAPSDSTHQVQQPTHSSHAVGSFSKACFKGVLSTRTSASTPTVTYNTASVVTTCTKIFTSKCTCAARIHVHRTRNESVGVEVYGGHVHGWGGSGVSSRRSLVFISLSDHATTPVTLRTQ